MASDTEIYGRAYDLDLERQVFIGFFVPIVSCHFVEVLPASSSLLSDCMVYGENGERSYRSRRGAIKKCETCGRNTTVARN